MGLWRREVPIVERGNLNLEINAAFTAFVDGSIRGRNDNGSATRQFFDFQYDGENAIQHRSNQMASQDEHDALPRRGHDHVIARRPGNFLRI